MVDPELYLHLLKSLHSRLHLVKGYYGKLVSSRNDRMSRTTERFRRRQEHTKNVHEHGQDQCWQDEDISRYSLISWRQGRHRRPAANVAIRNVGV